MKANFTLSDGDKAVTDADGKAKVTLKGTKAGAHTVTASMVGGKSEQLVVNLLRIRSLRRLILTLPRTISSPITLE